MTENIATRYLSSTEIGVIGGFTIPRLPENYEKEFGIGDFDTLRNMVRDSGKAAYDQHIGYAVAENAAGEVVGFAYTGGLVFSTKLKNGQRIEIPDVHLIFVHPDYRRRRIGTSLVDELLNHHEMLTINGVTDSGKPFEKEMLQLYGVRGGKRDGMLSKVKKTMK
jgi:GNAT superfamily N-acetyltransferase